MPQYFSIIIALFISLVAGAQSTYIQHQLFIKAKPGHPEIAFDAHREAPPAIAGEAKYFTIQSIAKAFRYPHEALQRVYVITVQDTLKVSPLMEVLEKKNWVEYIERIPNYQHFHTPNDLHPSQWYLKTINAEGGWAYTTGNPNTTVAIVDDAVMISHPDLAANIWNNPGEVPGNGIDDDANGFVDDVVGYDVANNDNNPAPPSNANAQYFSHGTHVAGIAAAATNNGQGIAGMGYDVSIIPVKVGIDSNASLVAAYRGVDYALTVGADVINMSWGGVSSSQTYQLLFDIAYQQGVVCVAAAGNSNTFIPMYPASYDHVISVGATNPGDKKAWFSNYGPTIDIMAPGTNIYSTFADPNIPYGLYNGTSMASPIVAGLAAIMQSSCKRFSVDEIEHCIESTAKNIDPINPLYAGQLGAGRVDAEAALRCILTPEITTNVTPKRICPGGQITFAVDTPCSVQSFTWWFEGGQPDTSLSVQPTVTYPTKGVYDIHFAFESLIGKDTLVYQNVIEVDSPAAFISGIYDVIPGGTAYIPVTLEGIPPFSITWTNGIDTFSQTSINTSPFLIPHITIQKDTIEILAIQDKFCTGWDSGFAVVTLLQDCSTSSLGDSTFENTYTSLNNFTTHSVNRDINGNLYITGLHQSSSGRNFFLLKLDAEGKPIWSKIYDGVNSVFGYPVNIKPLSNGLLALGGQRISTSIVFIDSTGTPQFAIDDPVNGSSPSDDYVRQVMELPNQTNDILVVGTANNRGNGVSDIMLFRANKNTGNIIWHKLIGRGSNEHGVSILPGSNNTFYVVGSSQSIGGPGNTSALITKYDYAGNHIWTETYDMNVNLFSMDAMIQNGIIYSVVRARGTSNGNEMLITKIDTSGKFIAAKSFHVNGNTEGIDIEPGVNGGIVVSGFNFSGGTIKLFMASMDDFLNVNWAKEYGNAFAVTVNAFGKNLITSKNGYFLGGGAGQAAYFIKTDLCGNSGCPSNDIIFQDTVRTLSTHGGTLNEISYNNILQPFTYTSSNISLIHDTLCTALTPPDTCGFQASLDSLLACAGDTSFFYSTIDPAAAAITLWDMGDGTIYSDRDTVAHLYRIPGNYTIQLIAYSRIQGCSDTFTTTIQIQSGFTATGGITDTICLEDTSYQLPPPTLSCGIPPFQYQWQPTTGLSDSTVPDPLLQPSGSQVYTLTISDSLGYSQQLLYAITIDSNCCYHDGAIVANDSSLCGSDSIQYSITGSNLIDVEWSFGPRASLPTYKGFNPPPVHYDTSGYFEVIAWVTDSCGLDTLSFFTPVFPAPAVDTLRDTSVCRGDTVQLGSAPLPYHEYRWQPATHIITSPDFSNPLVEVQGPITYTLTYTNKQTGCSGKQEVRLDTIPHIEPPLMQDTTLCFQPVAALTASTLLPNYRWSTGDTTASITLSGPGVYWVETFQCVATRDTFSVDTFATAKINTGTPVVCQGDSLYLSLTQGNWTNVQWTFGPSATPATFLGISPPPVVYSSSGTTNITVSYTYECGQDTLTTPVVIHPLPDVSKYTDASICEKDTFFYNITLPGYSAQWSPAAGLIDPQSADPGILAPQDSIQYSITLTDNATGCSQSTLVNIQVNPLPERPLVNDTLVCIGDEVTITAGNLAASFYWSNGSSTPSITVADTGWIWVANENACGTRRDSAFVGWYPPPTVNAGQDTAVRFPASVQLSGQGSGTPLWMPDSVLSCIDCFDPIASPNDTMTLYLQVADENGCTAIDSVTVFVIRLCNTLQLPNAFTPNNDGLNDKLEILGKGGKEKLLSFRIYNRWGEEIFSTQNFQQGWDGNMPDGTPAEVGVYTFVIHYLCNDEPTLTSGNVTLIR